MQHIRRVLKQDKEEIERLRISEFNRSTEFKLVKPEKLLWSEVDENNIVLAVFDENDTAISTMMGITVKEQSHAEKILNASLPDTILFPAIIFTSAATLKPFRRRGFNQLLRYYFMQYASSNKIKTLISPIYKGAPRIQFMELLGYEFIIPERDWQTKLTPTSQRQLGIFDCSKISNAMSVIQKYNSDVIDQYPWHGTELITVTEK